MHKNVVMCDKCRRELQVGENYSHIVMDKLNVKETCAYQSSHPPLTDGICLSFGHDLEMDLCHECTFKFFLEKHEEIKTLHSRLYPQSPS